MCTVMTIDIEHVPVASTQQYINIEIDHICHHQQPIKQLQSMNQVSGPSGASWIPTPRQRLKCQE